MPVVVTDAENGARGPKTFDLKANNNCDPKTFEATAERARASAAKVSANGGLVLAKYSANLETRNSIIFSTSAG